MAKAYVFLVEGFEVTEALSTVNILRRGKIDVSLVSLTGEKLVTGALDVTVQADLLFRDAAKGAADALILPGGPRTENYLKYPAFLDLLTAHTKAGKLTAAICAAPIVLAKLGLLSGKTATCYPTAIPRENLRKGGAIVSENMLERDGNILTAKGPGATPFFALEILRAMRGNEAADAVKQAFLLDFS